MLGVLFVTFLTELLVPDILYSSGFVNLSFSWFFMDAALGANVLTLSHISTCFFHPVDMQCLTLLVLTEI